MTSGVARTGSNRSGLIPTGPTPSVRWEVAADVVIIGSGAAGLTTAARCAAAGKLVVVISKANAAAGSTQWAQGGVAVVDTAVGDSVTEHAHDTAVAGAGLTDLTAATALVAAGPDAVERLRNSGANFDVDAFGRLLRTREGGHHRDRIIHAGGDATGAEIQRALLAAVGSPVVLEQHMAIDVLTTSGSARDAETRGAAKDIRRVAGVSVLDHDGRCGVITAPIVVLATGGSGQIFAATTNPAVATGDGIAMALRAGASVSDLEFVQFHPTALYTGALPSSTQRGQRPLVSEAVRGAGGRLIDAAGRPVMDGVHPLGDLAPRDVVALAITRRLAHNPCGINDHVYVDTTGIVDFMDRFPTITATCERFGIDRRHIPVVPAAHYQCGGVDTDLVGRTAVPGLYAVGEVARTGLHGANRLASNSLLECLVIGERAAADIISNGAHHASATRRAGQQPQLEPVALIDPADLPALQDDLSLHAGIGRSATGLAQIRLPHLVAGDLHPGALEAANSAVVAAAVRQAAAARTESRGCHVRLDYPHTEPGWQRSITQRLIDGRLTVDPYRAKVAS